jgi:hypothetical protein
MNKGYEHMTNAMNILTETRRIVDGYAEQGYDPLLWVVVSTQMERIINSMNDAMSEIES